MKNQFYDANDVAKLVYDANDVATCHLNILVPGSWHIFMKHLCGKRWDTDDFDRKSYEIFQVIISSIMKLKGLFSKWVLHQSEKLITVLNWLSISTSYD